MSRPTTSSTPALQLFAVTDRGPRTLHVAATSGTIHDVMDVLPDGVYSALRTFRHERFLELEAHLERTDRSMEGLGWKQLVDRPRLRAAIHAAVRDYPHADARVRFDVLAEPFELQGVRASVFLGLAPHAELEARFLEQGVRVDFARHLVREEPRIKTTAFVRARRPLPIGTQERFEHVLLDPRGRMLECSSSNLWFVRGRELVTAGDGVLEGITRKVILRLAPALGLTVRLERVDPEQLRSFDEAFLSSSIRGVVPIVGVEDARIGDGKVGERTRAITAAYATTATVEALPAA